MDKTQDLISNHLQQYGFIFQSSKIYDGLSNSWDYGPLGVELKNNLKRYWWKVMIDQMHNNVGLDSAIILNPRVWVSSGHVSTFNDPLVDCKHCHARFRADKLIEEQLHIEVNAEKEVLELLNSKKIVCPVCGKSDFTDIRKFNLMFKTYIGVVEDVKSEVYLRPETAQGIFINFKNVQRTERLKLPFGIGQIGKAFRNEISPGNFIFRTREFEQAELEFFCEPGESEKWYEFYVNKMYNFYIDLGINKDNLKIHVTEKDSLAHYALASSDIEYKFPFGWGEVCGIANRTDFDLKAHSAASSEVLDYFDQEKNIRFVPYCIEPSLGIDRLFLAVLTDAYDEEIVNGETRVVLRINKRIAPYQIAILPLSKQLNDYAEKIYKQLQKEYKVVYDSTQSIGKRYRRQDAIGTPYCVTVDFDSLNDKQVTVRDRDTMTQERISIGKLKTYFKKKGL